MITRHACGHVGRIATGKKAKAFIRVAEIRGRKVLEVDNQCPDCRKADDG